MMNQQQYRALWSLVRFTEHNRIALSGGPRQLHRIYNRLVKAGITDPGGARLDPLRSIERKRWETYSEEHPESRWLKYADSYRARHSGPVYYYHFSRDCDLYEVWGYYKFDNKHEADKAIQISYDCAEGPEIWNEITEEEYLKHEGENGHRDRAAEMMGY